MAGFLTGNQHASETTRRRRGVQTGNDGTHRQVRLRSGAHGPRKLALRHAPAAASRMTTATVQIPADPVDERDAPEALGTVPG